MVNDDVFETVEIDVDDFADPQLSTSNQGVPQPAPASPDKVIVSSQPPPQLASAPRRRTRKQSPIVAPLPQPKQQKQKKKLNVRWRQGTLDQNAVPSTFSRQNLEPLPSEISSLSTISQFFYYFFDDDLFTTITNESNLYSMQETGTCANISTNDVKKFVGICILSSVIALPNLRCLWNPLIGNSIAYEAMSVNHFEKVKHFLHFNDNFEMLLSTDPGYDRLYKIRPVIEKLLQNFQKIPVEEYLAIDEQLCATKHHSYLRQYLPAKPHKYGYKLFVLCGVSGFSYNFEIYSGQETPMLAHEPDLGPTGNVVIRLSRIIPRHVHHKLFFDNYFSSVPLLSYLESDGIHTCGTIRFNRLPSKKNLKANIEKNARGDFIEYICTHRSTPIVFLAWKDNKVVSMVSTYKGSLPMTMVRRYDRKNKKHIDVQCPALVELYNKHMGGVDTMDAMIGRHKIKIKSKKWYLKLFFHLMDMAVVNAWLLARRTKFIGNETPNWKFRLDLARSLCASGASRKMGRPSSTEPQLDFSKSKFSHTPLPVEDVRMDATGHWPLSKLTRRMCRFPACKNKTNVFCEKCSVYLCFTNNNNCFREFHVKK